MNTLIEGNVVTLKVRSPLWDAKDRYAAGVVREFNIYSGTIMREKWFSANEIGLTTKDKYFPFRVIRMENIAEIDGVVSDYIPPVVSAPKTVIVQGSKGDSYTVVKDGLKSSCTCKGFSFRKTCKHIEGVK